MTLALFSAACGTAVGCATGTTLDDDAIQTGSVAGTGNSSGSTGATGSSDSSGSMTGSSSASSTSAGGTGGAGSGATTTSGTGGFNGSTSSGAGGSASNGTGGAASATSSSSGAGGAGGGTCGAGTADCDGNPMNGCEDLQSDPNHCGVCMTACPMAEGGPTCTNGKCHITVTILDDQLEDTYINSGSANTNYGSNGAILIDDDDGGDQYITFIQPTTLGSLPIGAGATIVNARLELTCYNPGNNFGVHLVTGAWTESTLTWSNAPPFTASSFLTVSPQCSGVGTTNSINIAAALTAWAGGQAQLGLRLRSSGIDGTDWRSTEFATVNQRPKIVFTYY